MSNRKNKIEAALSVEQLQAFLADLKAMPSPTLAKIQDLVLERFKVKVSLMSAKTFRDKNFEGYLARLQQNADLAKALSAAREGNPGATLADAAGDLLSREVFELLNNYPELGEALRELKPNRLASVIQSLRGEDRKAEAVRLAEAKWREQIEEKKAALLTTLGAEQKRGGISKETIERIEHQLKLL